MTTKPTIRMFAPFILLLALCAAMMTLVLRMTAAEANRIDLENAKASVSASLRSETDSLKILANDNALWDDAARAVYGAPDMDFLWSSWGATTSESNIYNIVAIIDPAGRTLHAYADGKAVQTDIKSDYGPSMSKLLAAASQKKDAVGGFVRKGHRLSIVGIMDIMPITRSLETLVPMSGPYRLVFIKHLTPDLIAKIGVDSNVAGLQLVDQPNPITASATITDISSAPLGTLAWLPPLTGNHALEKAYPIIALAFLLVCALAMLVMRGWLQMMKKFHAEALTDSLSGLPNRRALRHELGEMVSEHPVISIAMLDLDGFKAVNDRFGHMAGDRLIREVALLLQDMTAGRGRVARLGGDEFAIVVAGADSPGWIESISRELLTRFTTPFRLDDRTAAVGVSIGLASVENQSASASELMRRADVALYTAKRAGKMRLRWYTEGLDEAQVRARSIENDLRTALERSEFSLVYQPVFDHLGNRIRSVEALLRWHRPGPDPVEPTEFIPIAEYSGLIDRIGMWVVRRACLDGLAWSGVNVAVNVSVAQLRNPEFAALLSEVLEETGFPPLRLELEISERFLAVDPAHARKMIDEIRALGVSVVLDEYGSGLSSLSFLRNFSFSKLKVDRSMTAEAQSDEATRSVVHSSVAVARALGMAVTIGGIENQEQADLMRVTGCDELQGWHFSGEVDARDVSELVSKSEALSPPVIQRRA